MGLFGRQSRSEKQLEGSALRSVVKGELAGRQQEQERQRWVSQTLEYVDGLTTGDLEAQISALPGTQRKLLLDVIVDYGERPESVAVAIGYEISERHVALDNRSVEWIVDYAKAFQTETEHRDNQIARAVEELSARDEVSVDELIGYIGEMPGDRSYFYYRALPSVCRHRFASVAATVKLVQWVDADYRNEAEQSAVETFAARKDVAMAELAVLADAMSNRDVALHRAAIVLAQGDRLAPEEVATLIRRISTGEARQSAAALAAESYCRRNQSDLAVHLISCFPEDQQLEIRQQAVRILTQATSRSRRPAARQAIMEDEVERTLTPETPLSTLLDKLESVAR